MLSERVEALEEANFRTKQALNEKGAVNGYLLEQTKLQLNRLETIVNENKQLKARVDYLTRQAKEIDDMRESENLKIIRDTQYYKDKCD